jgi:hypothetical protein
VIKLRRMREAVNGARQGRHLKGRDHLGDLGVYGMILIKIYLKE